MAEKKQEAKESKMNEKTNRRWKELHSGYGLESLWPIGKWKGKVTVRYVIEFFPFIYGS